MCGINGIINGTNSQIHEMNQAIKHRGPDGSGFDTQDSVTLGHVRLAIVDLTDAGHQPMHYCKNSGASSKKHRSAHTELSPLSITYNGEVYNYVELKKELAGLGYTFTTESDTEVILASYLEWGEDCVNHFNGMWAFCIHDKKKNILFCSRDRFGQKPFHYTTHNGNFIFSSELKGIVQVTKKSTNEDISSEAVDLYFALGFIPSPWTIYTNVFKLQAGHNLVYDLHTKRIRTKQYYELPVYTPEYNKKKLIKEGAALLQDATKLRMRSDVPVGAFLSGGLDSSSVVAEMVRCTKQEKPHTFSIGFEGTYDETPYITIVKNALGTNHHHEYFTQKEFEKTLPVISEIYDEPYGSASAFPTTLVSQHARNHVTVSLSGDGGDEVFAGYPSHQAGRIVDMLTKIPSPVRTLLQVIPHRSFKRVLELCDAMPQDFRYLVNKKGGYTPEIFIEWTRDRQKYAWSKSGGSVSEMNRIFDMLFFTLPDDYLTKVDRASMHHALEVRSPFMDYRFMEFSQTIPSKWKTAPGQTPKILMKSIIATLVPISIVRRKKQGFTPPVLEWIIDEKYKETLIQGISLVKSFSPELADLYTEKYMRGESKRDRLYLIRLFMFINWHKKHISE